MESKKWLYKEAPTEDQISDLGLRLNTSRVVTALLLQRDVHTYEKAKSFFRPSLNDLHDPFMFESMDICISRLVTALENKEKILLYGDYDVDGTTAVSIFYSFLRELGADVYSYIPCRYSEGYGVSRDGIIYASDNDISLILTLDCGIRDNHNLEDAQSRGIDVIICDHHEPGPEVPKVLAIINPKIKGSGYPFDGLSGCAVGFKVMQAFCLKVGIDLSKVYKYLDLVAISIGADIVPIVGENRILAYHGLNILRETDNIGLSVLLGRLQISTPYSISKVVFGIAPIINSAGRLDHASTVIQLLTTHSESTANNLVTILLKHNTDRRDIDRDITEQALGLIEADESFQDACSTVLYDERWHKGVLGIVASRCIERHYRPTVIMTKSGSGADFQHLVTGSVRSIKGVNVYKVLSSCSDLLERYGGHEYAAGLTLNINNIDSFRRRFDEIVSSMITPSELIPILNIDIEISLKDINHKMMGIISQMAPFGPANPSPVFSTTGLTAVSYKILKEEHLKMRVRPRGCSTIFDAIGFGMARHEPIIKDRKSFDMAYKIEKNDYLGRTEIQLNIKDIKPN